MAGDDHATAPALEQLSHGFAAIGVKVVGGLVQQQHIRRLDQQAGEGHACSFAAAEGSKQTIRWQSGQAGLNQRCVQPGLQCPVDLGGIVR